MATNVFFLEDGVVSFKFEEEKYSMLFSLNVLSWFQDRFGALSKIDDVLNVESETLRNDLQEILTYLMNEGRADGTPEIMPATVERMMTAENTGDLIRLLNETLIAATDIHPEKDGENDEKKNDDDSDDVMFDIAEYYAMGLVMGLPIKETARLTLRQFKKLNFWYQQKTAMIGGAEPALDPIDEIFGGL